MPRERYQAKLEGLRDDVLYMSELVVRDLIESENLGDAGGVEGTMRNVSRLLVPIRDLERVGDHAVNIAARGLYMIENDDALLY